MTWVAVAIGGASLIGSVLSSSSQSSSASQAAGDQEQAAIEQLVQEGNVFNAQGEMSLPTREAGGLAQSREAYLLGLTPNLNINPDFSFPQMSVNPQTGSSSLSYNGPGAYGPTGSLALSGAVPNYSTGMNPSGGGAGYTYPNGSVAPGAGAFSLAGGGYSIPGRSGAAGGGIVAPGGTAASPAGSMGAVPNPNAGMPASAYGSYATPYSPSTFFMSPDYNFILGQNENQIKNQAAATGGAGGGNALTAAMGYASGLASQDFNQAYTNSLNTQAQQFNMLNAMSTGGQVATAGLSTAAGQYGSAASSSLAGYGNAGAAGAIGVGNAYSSGINGAIGGIQNGAMMYNNLNNGNNYNLGYTNGAGQTVYSGISQNGGTGGGVGNLISPDADSILGAS